MTSAVETFSRARDDGGIPRVPSVQRLPSTVEYCNVELSKIIVVFPRVFVKQKECKN